MSKQISTRQKWETGSKTKKKCECYRTNNFFSLVPVCLHTSWNLFSFVLSPFGYCWSRWHKSISMALGEMVEIFLLFFPLVSSIHFFSILFFFASKKWHDRMRLKFVKDDFLLTLRTFYASKQVWNNMMILGNVGQTVQICQKIFTDK